MAVLAMIGDISGESNAMDGGQYLCFYSKASDDDRDRMRLEQHSDAESSFSA